MADSEYPNETARNESVFVLTDGKVQTDLYSKMLPEVTKKLIKLV